MPHEKINHPMGNDIVPGQQLVVEWFDGWAQVAIYPEGWTSTGDAARVDMTPAAIDLLIKTLRRAKKQAYGAGQPHSDSFRDGGPLTETRPLFPPRPPHPERD